MRQQLLFWNTVFLLCVSLTYAQQKRNITGVVQDETGLELPGASVVIKGTTAGTTTDLNGKFTLEVEDKDFIVVSFIGYKNSEKAVQKTTNFTFVLTPEQASLDEVVITALGISKAEKKIGYATQNIDVKKVQEVATPNMGSLLSGQVAGLQVSNPPGMLQAPKFSLRGKDPLIVIDGIPVTTDFYDVSPEDIANINVLKGTSASVLYGSLGRNGAIMITTKNAKTEGITVEVSQKYND